ncbi:MAG: hypothetical protein IT310_05015 [Anaerolineales bacterium]|nr:hypothetical protein [Anaerolineales bacterium]
MTRLLERNKALIVLAGAGFLLYRAALEFYNIASGTGHGWSAFSPTWGLLYLGFLFFCAVLFVALALFFWKNNLFTPALEYAIEFKSKHPTLRWFLWFLVLAAPIYFFQYTPWGVAFQKPYLRVLVWVLMVGGLTVLSSPGKRLTTWNQFLVSLIVTASLFSIFATLKEVTSYPFSLGWSEGNRLWDYSVMFGRDAYLYPKDKPIPVLLDKGRQFVGGLPFLLPNVNIVMVRAWVGLTLIFPYLLLGLATFRKLAKGEPGLWFLLTFWAFLFLKQGPIHPPLVLCAALVALAWGSSLWISIPLVVAASYFAQLSRFTWVFAPGLWIFMLELASASLPNLKPDSVFWKRALPLGIVAILGGFLLKNLPNLSNKFIPADPPATLETPAQVPQVAVPSTPSPTSAPAPNYFEYVVTLMKDQPLLWYRLLPNSTYGQGILIALFWAAMPMVILLFYLSIKKVWNLNALQKAAFLLPLLAFLGVGLVASTKIGGGGDLHNMDMFLIGLFFTGVLAWQNGGRAWLQTPSAIPFGLKITLTLLLAISSLTPLLEMRSYSFGEDLPALQTLADVPDNNTLEMLPTQQTASDALQTIQEAVEQAKTQGEVLFMDQRQLLTFGYIQDVPFVPDYEKKLLMNQALSGNRAYFEKYYADLAKHRFTLIVSEPLRTPVQDSSFEFGEENNAWVKWVSIPTLCYYEPLVTLKAVRVQLLIPNSKAEDCSTILPQP